MKLLYCDICGDIFNLRLRQVKTCTCGHVKGQYDDNTYASVNGNGRSLAIGNGSLHNALYANKAQFDYTRSGGDKLITFIAWVRPHTGPRNPHTIIDEDL